MLENCDSTGSSVAKKLWEIYAIFFIRCSPPFFLYFRFCMFLISVSKYIFPIISTKALSSNDAPTQQNTELQTVPQRKGQRQTCTTLLTWQICTSKINVAAVEKVGYKTVLASLGPEPGLMRKIIRTTISHLCR